MRHFSTIAVVVVLLLGSALPVRRTGAAPAADMRALDAFITKALADYQVPGAAVAVVHNGEVVLAKGYGVRDATRPEPVDEHTPGAESSPGALAVGDLDRAPDAKGQSHDEIVLAYKNSIDGALNVRLTP